MHPIQFPLFLVRPWPLPLVAFFALLALAQSGCASRSYVTLLESPDGSTGQVVLRGDRGEQVIYRAREAAPLDGSTAPTPIDEAKLKADFGAAMAARPPLPEHFLLYFELGGVTLTAESTARLDGILTTASRRTAVDLSVIGHTDTVGDPRANEALALERAQSVAALLRSRGLQFHALTVESHGERNLLVPTPDETREQRNRRVEISIR